MWQKFCLKSFGACAWEECSSSSFFDHRMAKVFYFWKGAFGHATHHPSLTHSFTGTFSINLLHAFPGNYYKLGNVCCFVFMQGNLMNCSANWHFSCTYFVKHLHWWHLLIYYCVFVTYDIYHNMMFVAFDICHLIMFVAFGAC